ncbi:MAG: LPS export ABC transporter permease LptG [Candidatus Krumholzibacteria bacterium]|nr:LPS export ABC transporter permease LptG [Candidatus Krumholzibacteria bacterium]
MIIVRIHDRYILNGFLRNVLIGLIAFTVIYVTVDVTEETDNFLDHNAKLAHVTLYYLYKIPWILILILPVSVLLATVFSLGKLARENELTAFIASGTSLTRVAMPILVAAFLISLLTIVFAETLVPKANRKSEEIMLVEIEKKKARSSFRFKNNLHYQGEGNRVYYADKYDLRLSVLMGVVVQEYEESKLTRRIDAKKAFWDGARWVFMNGAVREFLEVGEKITTFDRLPMPELPEKPEDLAKEEIEPEEMNYIELKDYIEKVKRSGGSVDKYLVDLYVKFSFPLTSLIFAVIGAALSSAKRKPSMATGFGLTLFISFSYYGILRIGQALGHSGVIQPMFGAWMGNIIFLAVGGMLLYKANR